MNTTITRYLARGCDRPLHIAAVIAAAFVTILWLWSCLCSFPLHPWNAIRIAPAFMWTAGVTPYPPPGLGPVTTWIYGPIPLLVLWPATWAKDAATGLIIAGVINLLVMLVPAVWVARQHLPTSAGKSYLALAVVLIAALWPAANLTFWQADNVAIALGYLAIAVIKDARPQARTQLWLASTVAILALWAKPTELGPALGQIAWVGLCFGTRAAFAHAARCVACGGATGLFLLAIFGVEGVVYNMFIVPAGLPMVPLVEKALQAPFLFHVLLGVVLPVSIVLATIRRVLIRRDMLALCYLMFLASLPFNLMGFSSIGGNINSLHAHLYLIPVLISVLSRFQPQGRPLFFPGAMIIVILSLGFHFAKAPVFVLRPATEAAEQAEQLARDHAGRLYLPWHPLATYFGEGRFDHVEDGIMTRAHAKRPLNETAVHRHLPRAFSMVAYQEFVYEGFVTRRLVPDGAVQSSYGNWQILSWNPASWSAIPMRDPLKFAPDEPAPSDPSTLRP